jgi:hypothetical protein
MAPPPNNQTTAVDVVFKKAGSSIETSNLNAQVYEYALRCY